MGLSEAHQKRLLDRYGIDPAHPSIKKMVDDGLLASVDQATAESLLGQDVPSGGILIKYPGSENFTIRLDLSKKGEDGRERKYLRASGAKNLLYVPPGLDVGKLDDIWLTEGELKALRASLEGLPVIALSGVWNWRDGQAKDDLAGLIPDLDRDWGGKNFVLIYDSDIKPAHAAYLAFPRLADVLYAHGARRVKIITLPEIKDLKKAGLDDFINRLGENALSRLRDIIKAAPYIVPAELGYQRFVEQLRLRSERDPDIGTDIELATKALLVAGKEAEAQDLLKSFNTINTERRRAFISDAKRYAKAKKAEEEEAQTTALSKKLRYQLCQDQVNQEVIKICYKDRDGSERAEYTYSDSSKLKKWIIDQVEQITGKTPDRNLVDKIKSSITAQYLHTQTELAVGRRFLKIDGIIYYNLNDAENRVLQITADGIKILSNGSGPEVAFVNPSQALAQTMPDLTARPSDLGLLFSEGLVNITDPTDQMVYKVLLASSLATDGPRYIACFHGEAGAGKSSVAEVIKRLLDPEKASRQKVPSSPDGRKSLFNNRDVVLLDNVTSLPEWMLNDLCLASTGGHDVDRKLYTDSDEVLIDLHKLVVLTGVNPVGSWRSDFVDRCIVFKLKRIDRVQDETAIWRRFEELRPRLFGAIVNIAKEALKILPQIQETDLTRISTGSRFGEACARALGYAPNEFMNVLKMRHKTAHILTASTDTVGEALLAFMQDRPSFEGTYSDLHRELSYLVADDARRQRSWPKNSQSLSRKINQILPSLRAAGIDIEDDPDSRRGIIITNKELAKNEAQQLAEAASETDESKGDLSMPGKEAISDALDGITKIASSNNRDAAIASDAMDAMTHSLLPYKKILKGGNKISTIKNGDNASMRPLRPGESQHSDFSRTQLKSIASNCVRKDAIDLGKVAPSQSKKDLDKVKGADFPKSTSIGEPKSNGVKKMNFELNEKKAKNPGSLMLINKQETCALCEHSFPGYQPSYFFFGPKGPVCSQCAAALENDPASKKAYPKDDAGMLFHFGWLERLSTEDSERITVEIEQKATDCAMRFAGVEGNDN